MGAQLSIRGKWMIKATEQVRPVKTINMIIKMVKMLRNKYYRVLGHFGSKPGTLWPNSIIDWNSSLRKHVRITYSNF